MLKSFILNVSLLQLFILCLSLSQPSSASDFEQGKVIDYSPSILSQRDRVEPANRIILDRLNNLLPKVMAETDIDLWLVINREYEEDPLFYSLVPHTTFAARRTTMLVFSKDEQGNVERFTVSRYPITGFYETRWEGGSLDEQWKRLGEIIAEIDPKKIAINTSEHWPLADGLTHGLYRLLYDALDEKYRERLVSAEPLVIRWMETRTAAELDIYPHVVNIARSVIAEAFSSKVITPGATTTDDVAWYIRERFESLQLRPWFQPYVNVQRKGDKIDKDSPFFGASGVVIKPGDVLHTDVGICYLKMCTDTQEMGYVLRLGESEVPQGLVKALAVGNQWQDKFTDEFKTGRTGNEILAKTKKAMKRAKILASTYTHPIGFVGHAIGPTIGMWDNQGNTPVRGDWKLFPNTAYAIEGNIKTQVKEWDNQWVQIKLEQTAVFNGKKVIYLAGRQTEWHVVR
ncbi:aminopeptidase P family protein [Aliikangiella marina]|uniref:Aminopeptidase P family protein n=1 Tax=Aliikangiella marina TaxID=1712262 RepID=A0A545TJ73_9GAMM|nr:M24 family metallopeptidase [Aliikangiella marina]TQV77282.1 aminopeptidase P family protein [Aliikangiella marina]